MKNILLFNLLLFSAFIIGCKRYKVPAEKLILAEESQLNKKPKEEIKGTPVINPNEICTTYQVTWDAGEKESLLLDPSEDVIFPGAIIQSESLQNGKFTPVTGKRYPIIISTPLLNVKRSSDTIQNPTLNSVTESIKKILLSKNSGVQYERYVLNITDIYSEEDYKLKVNASYSFPSGSVRSGFDFSNGRKKSRFFADFTQIFYSINVNNLERDEFFKKKPDANLGFSPVYVGSIKYGRRIMLVIESDSIYNHKKSELEAEFTGISTGGSLSAESSVSKLIREKSIKVLVVGGGTSNNNKWSVITNPSQLYDVIRKNAVWDPRTNPGAPMTYTLRHTSDNSIFMVAQAGNYTVRKCELNPTQNYLFTPTVRSITNLPARHLGGDPEFRGHGPKVDLTVTLSVIDNEVFANIHCTWLEWDRGGSTPQEDFSNGVVDERRSLGKIPEDLQFLGFNSKATFQHTYIESDEEPDGASYIQGDSFVKSWTIIGDTHGNDLEGRTGIVRIEFHPFLLNVKKIK